ncbi:MAG: tRNA uridine-5-carboxymethylaminomethyl(34) synthesis GTPase MnmE [Oscillospiraceae bacterium]|nr:tRNA uridine-5-carboxymethylaminomethyl(34) synthesis GTPase MnmE [Oscillospiraceae bacterium]
MLQDAPVLPPRQDTIAAIATATAPSGVGIVRISGPDAIFTASCLFRPKNPLDWSQWRGYEMRYGTVLENAEAVDEAICLLFRAPKSYTGEDVVELSCHGGPVILRRVLRAALAAGARLAAPGEFTQRAFQNGKLDLTAAEAVLDLVSARSEQAAAAARSARCGALREVARALATPLLALSAQLSAWTDYADEEIPDLTPAEVRDAVAQACAPLADLLSRYDSGAAVTHGVTAVLSGRPNVGKSTLMNLLAGYDRSIVTAFPGTTRDAVEETLHLGSVLLCLKDTAGIRATDHPVERLGVERSRAALADAQLILLVLDASAPLTSDDFALLAACAGRPCVAVCNKSDLSRRADLAAVRASVPRLVSLSAATGNGLDDLRQAVEETLDTAAFDPAAAMLANERQRDCAFRAHSALQEALSSLEDGFTLDVVQILVDDAIAALLELTGERVTEAATAEIFSRFCVGK